MKKTKFKLYIFTSRKDLLHFVEEYADKNVYEKIGSNPRVWLGELQIISHMLNKENLVGFSGIEQAPVGDPDFKELGNGAYLYRGEKRLSRGLWIKEDISYLEKEIAEANQWAHYGMGSIATVNVNKEFLDIPAETFLPENFEKISKNVQKRKRDMAAGEKRPIFQFSVNHEGEQLGIYAKGAYLTFDYYDTPPAFRLTSLSDIVKITSEEEMENSFRLASLGANVPRVIAYYKAPVEEFLFVEEIKGKTPDKFLDSSKKDIIKKDSRLLATFCLSGFRKVGFADFDDKIYDGKDLYLVDTEEFIDLYFPMQSEFRNILLNPKNTKELKRFRIAQKSIFRRMLRDSLFKYKENLTPTKEDQKLYIETFYLALGWKKPTEEEITNLINFPIGYMTTDTWMAVRSDIY